MPPWYGPRTSSLTSWPKRRSISPRFTFVVEVSRPLSTFQGVSNSSPTHPLGLGPETRKQLGDALDTACLAHSTRNDCASSRPRDKCPASSSQVWHSSNSRAVTKGLLWFGRHHPLD